MEVTAHTETDALWAFEAALGCRGVGLAVCELRETSLDLTVTRRATMRARDHGVTGLLLRLASRAEPTAAEIRFALAPAPAGTIGGFAAGVGRPAWRLTLEKNRGGPTGAFSVEWKPHERSFAEPGGEEREAGGDPPGGRGTPMRILSLFLPRLSTDRLIRRRRLGAADAPPEGVPLAVAAKEKSAVRIVAVDRLAEQRGVRLGLTLADARGAVPDLHVVEADAAADLAMLERVADWCDRYTPLVALDPPDGLFLDISGCAHLFAGGGEVSGEAVLLADCLSRLRHQGFEARAAVASTAGAAWAVARYGAGGPGVALCRQAARPRRSPSCPWRRCASRGKTRRCSTTSG